MAVYNGDRFLREQLESFADQTRLPDELIVSDNASTDRTVEMVREFAARAPFVVRLVINDRNLGVAKNFERAIGECTGDVIFLSDSDDVWYCEKLRTMEKALEKNPLAGVVICDADLVDQQLCPLGRREWQNAGVTAAHLKRLSNGELLSTTFPVRGNCVAFRSAFKALVLPFPEGERFLKGWHDYFIIWSIVYSGAAGAVFIPRVLVAHRKHPSQMAGTAISSRWRRLRANWAARVENPSAMLAPVMERLETSTAREYCADPRIPAAVLRHWRARCNLPARRVARMPIVLRELATLRYRRLSNGILTAAKDVLFVQ
jgi:glycosyltransferase involved in cell wall biosynthesis